MARPARVVRSHVRLGLHYPRGVSAVHHLALRTRDVAGLAAFYRDLFGLRVAREQPGYSVWLALAGGALMIERAADDEPAIPTGSMELVAFAVTAEERARFRDALAAQGIAVEAETAHTTYARDPDGRRVAASTYPFGW